MNLIQISVTISLLFVSANCASSSSTPLNCSDTGRLCTSFIAFQQSNQTLVEIQSMFDVFIEDITVDINDPSYIFIRKNCSCLNQIKQYLTNTTYTMRKNEGAVYDIITEAYEGLSLFPNISRVARSGSVISLHLLCGCSSKIWNYYLSYVLRDGDTIASLASRFGVSMDNIEEVNGIVDPENLTVGSVYYIPLNSAPGHPYNMDKGISPASASAPAPSTFGLMDTVIEDHHSSHFPYGWIVGGVGGVLFLFLVVLFYVLPKSSVCSGQNHGKNSDGKRSHSFHILGSTSFCHPSRRYLCCKSGDCNAGNGGTSGHQANVPRVVGADVLHMEKPIVFSYEEILSATSGFSDSNLLGHGTYGSVYYAVLQDQEVAIKRMTATKTKEFISEIKVLCTVHHSSLVELIGYAASDQELFLVYEYAVKGSLKNHLHDPQSKGQTPLSWISRVQIALDTARGLEYIHEHTKAHYVHRDIKSSNILLDGAFRSKVSDFGLAKLIGRTGDGEASATKVVGTFGYVAPEYLSDGLATTKSDVYAFGVVLFELMSGREAITKTEGLILANSERRSLVSIMLAALRNSPNSMSMSSLKECIDPNLMDLYPHDCAYKVAMVAKQCVEEDPALRPDMKQVVISLSHILLSSVEWEATLAGNSQIFSGLVQGR